MSLLTHYLAIVLATAILLIMPSNASIQITNPAPLAKTLDMNPTPNLRWVYTSDSPAIIGILIRQVETDVDANLIGVYREGTRTEWSTVPLSFTGTDVKPGMNVTIAIVDPSDTEDRRMMPVLDSVGPLLLREGHKGIVPVDPDTTTEVDGNTTEGATIGPTVNGSVTPIGNDTIAPSTTSTPESFTTQTDGITDAPTTGATKPASASSTATTTSEADKLFRATAAYMASLFLLAIPAFVAGINS